MKTKRKRSSYYDNSVKRALIKVWEIMDCPWILKELYGYLRLYINFFQPVMKQISKERQGSRVTKRYDRAKTPYQRILDILK